MLLIVFHGLWFLDGTFSPTRAPCILSYYLQPYFICFLDLKHSSIKLKHLYGVIPDLLYQWLSIPTAYRLNSALNSHLKWLQIGMYLSQPIQRRLEPSQRKWRFHSYILMRRRDTWHRFIVWALAIHCQLQPLFLDTTPDYPDLTPFAYPGISHSKMTHQKSKPKVSSRLRKMFSSLIPSSVPCSLLHLLHARTSVRDL